MIGKKIFILSDLIEVFNDYLPSFFTALIGVFIGYTDNLLSFILIKLSIESINDYTLLMKNSLSCLSFLISIFLAIKSYRKKDKK